MVYAYLIELHQSGNIYYFVPVIQIVHWMWGKLTSYAAFTSYYRFIWDMNRQTTLLVWQSIGQDQACVFFYPFLAETLEVYFFMVWKLISQNQDQACLFLYPFLAATLEVYFFICLYFISLFFALSVSLNTDYKSG